jgi:hypothetical protein
MINARRVFLFCAAVVMAATLIGCSKPAEPEFKWFGETPKWKKGEDMRYFDAYCPHHLQDGSRSRIEKFGAKMDLETHGELEFTWPESLPCHYCDATGVCDACHEHKRDKGKRKGDCPVCLDGVPVLRCATCDGTGTVMVPGQDLKPASGTDHLISEEDMQQKTCPVAECKGSGLIVVAGKQCVNCDGSGECPICAGDAECDFCDGEGKVILADKQDFYGLDNLRAHRAREAMEEEEGSSDEGSSDEGTPPADGTEEGAEEGSEEGAE